MPTSQNSPLSYQTTMPEYPDVTYQAYSNFVNRSYHGPGWDYGITGQGSAPTAEDLANPDNYHVNQRGRLGTWLTGLINGNPDYKTWRTNLLDEYNAKMSAYNTWLQTGEGQRASLESGDYNPSYFGGQQASSSPLNYQDVNESNGLSEMAQGVSGILSFVQALQGLSMASAQIRGINLKNAGLAIENAWKDKLLSGKNDLLGFQADKQNLQNSFQLYSMFKDMPELWKSGLTHFGRSDYDLRGMDKSLSYQRAVQDIDYLSAGTALRKAQEDMAHWNNREKQWYKDNIWEIQKAILQGQLTYQSGEINFQQVEQKLRKAGAIARIGTDVVNTAVNAVKTFVPMFRGIDAAGSLMGSRWAPQTSWSPGVDITTGDMYGRW